MGRHQGAISGVIGRDVTLGHLTLDGAAGNWRSRLARAGLEPIARQVRPGGPPLIHALGSRGERKTIGGWK